MIDIIAIGSPFNTDAVSWQLLESLHSTLDQSEITCHYLDRPGVQLVQEIQGKECVILLDALLADSNHGSISHLDWHSLQANDRFLSSHEFSVANALQLASRLNRMPAQLHVLGIHVNPDHRLNQQQLTQALQQLAHYINKVVLT